MVRYLRHFALVMVLEDRGLTVGQMQSVIGISENLIQEYRDLYAALSVPVHDRALERIRRSVFRPARDSESSSVDAGPLDPTRGEKGGQR